MTAVRSGLYLVAFYVNLTIFFIGGLPILVMPRRWGLPVMRLWLAVSDGLLAVICGLRVEIRGAEHLPRGAALVASKHQSAWETLALLRILPDPAMVLKRELTRLPLFGWYVLHFGHVPVDRSGGAKALRETLAQARRALAEDRPLVIFPEGTRTAPGAPPDYQRGVAALYRDLGVACVPVALNSGLFWPRNSLVRKPGTIVVEFLPAIEPGLPAREFLSRLEHRIETASTALLPQ